MYDLVPWFGAERAAIKLMDAPGKQAGYPRYNRAARSSRIGEHVNDYIIESHLERFVVSILCEYTQACSSTDFITSLVSATQ